MTQVEFNKIAFQKFSGLAIEDLKGQAVKLSNNISKEVDPTFWAILDYLEANINEADFVSFCNSL